MSTSSVWTSAKPLTDDGPITIGAPIPGVTYHLIAESGAEPAPGELGELCIGGDVLARGYLGDPTRTRDRFGTGKRRYRTGDLARRLDNGELQLAGRTDQQIKIDGYRVELTEVEAVLATAAGCCASTSPPRRTTPWITCARRSRAGSAGPWTPILPGCSA